MANQRKPRDERLPARAGSKGAPSGRGISGAKNQNFITGRRLTAEGLTRTERSHPVREKLERQDKARGVARARKQEARRKQQAEGQLSRSQKQRIARRATGRVKAARG